jgi:hypothetical protein
MKTVNRRLNRLEDRLGSKKPRNVFRLVVTRSTGGEPDLEKATCSRHYAGGLLTELIKLNSCDNPFTREELDRFVERFPITRGQD